MCVHESMRLCGLYLLSLASAAALGRRQLITYGSVWSVARPRPVHGLDAPPHVYMYGEVDSESCLKLVNTLLEEERTQLAKRGGKLTPIHLHVQSGGGALTPALHVCDVIDAMTVPVHTFVEGTVASAASLITVVADKRYMTKRSTLLLHQPSMELGELRYDMLTDKLYNVQLLYKSMVDLYVDHSKLRRTDVEALLATEKYLTAAQAKERGLVDVVL